MQFFLGKCINGVLTIMKVKKNIYPSEEYVAKNPGVGKLL